MHAATQLAGALDDPLRSVVVGPGDEAAEQGRDPAGEVLAAEVLEDAALDPGVVALEEEQGSDEVEIDGR